MAAWRAIVADAAGSRIMVTVEGEDAHPDGPELAACLPRDADVPVGARLYAVLRLPASDRMQLRAWLGRRERSRCRLSNWFATLTPIPGAGWLICCDPADGFAGVRDTETDRGEVSRLGLIASMSYELRIPLNTLVGFAELLAQRGPDLAPARTASYVSFIKGAAEDLLDTITILLEVSEIDDRVFVDRSLGAEVDLVMASVLVVLKSRAERRYINVVAVPGLPGMSIDVDFDSLRQLLMLLMVDVLARAPGGATVEMRSRLEPGGRGAIVVGVRRQPEDARIPISAIGSNFGTLRHMAAIHGIMLDERQLPGGGADLLLLLPPTD